MSGRGVLLAVLLASTGCSDGGGDPAPASAFVWNAGGVREIRWQGTVVAGTGVATGGYYVIGSCTGGDGPDNVTSVDAAGVLQGNDRCPGSPFAFAAERLAPDRLHVRIQVGPTVTAYRTLSVPLDGARGLFHTFRFADPGGYEVDACGPRGARAGTSGRFDSLPTCLVPGLGPISVAVTAPRAWAEIEGDGVTLRRTILGGAYREWNFFEHPGSHNLEANWTGGETLPARSVVELEEELWLR